MLYCSSVYIRMQPPTLWACTGAALWSRVRNGLQPNGFTWGLLTNQQLPQQAEIAPMKMRTVLNGLLQVNVKRILFIWLAPMASSGFVGRVAMLAHHRNAPITRNMHPKFNTYLPLFLIYPKAERWELYFHVVYITLKIIFTPQAPGCSGVGDEWSYRPKLHGLVRGIIRAVWRIRHDYASFCSNVECLTRVL